MTSRKPKTPTYSTIPFLQRPFYSFQPLSTVHLCYYSSRFPYSCYPNKLSKKTEPAIVPFSLVQSTHTHIHFPKVSYALRRYEPPPPEGATSSITCYKWRQTRLDLVSTVHREVVKRSFVNCVDWEKSSCIGKTSFFVFFMNENWTGVEGLSEGFVL